MISLQLQIFEWMYDFVVIYGYIGAFIISIFGNLTIIFPVPYALVIYSLGALPEIDPLILGIVSGLGAMIGELSAYVVGFGGRKLLEEKQRERVEAAKRIIERFGDFAIFLFAVTPLPDDVILIPLGMMKYSLKRILVACLAGKIVMCTILGYGGKLSLEFVKAAFSGGGFLGIIVSTVLIVFVILLLLKVDWIKFLEPKAESQ